ncbi:chemotaxis protein CheC [Halobacterium yunchengense]|uniref:chemotaxis protein CheC n=1 Tax=Halobacterium yunchengense TaxID=3108497 RepID=UPI00300BBF11
MSTMIDIRRLQTVNKLAREGATTVADNLSQLTGVDTEMQITKINVLDVEDLAEHLGAEKQVGVNVPLLEEPYGSVLVLFDDRSARRVASTMMGGVDSDGGAYSDMERSAIKEVGNIMTSGFIDGWANVLGRTIDISTPNLFRAAGDDIVAHCVEPNDHEIAMVFDATLHAPDADVEAKIYSFPDVEEFVSMINDI